MVQKEVVLSKRMQMVAGMVTKGNRAADIGCDHGFVSIYLIKQGICPHVIAMDVNEGPLLRAKTHISRRGLDPYIEVRISDGMDQLQPKEAESIIIAGMGGRLVTKILSAHMDRVRELREIILQPQSELHLVRKFLAENGLEIIQEDMVEDAGKYYPCMKAVYTGKQILSYSETELWYGPLLLKQKNPVLREYLLREKNAVLQIKDEIAKNAKKIETGAEKEDTIRKRAERIEHALSYFTKEKESVLG